MNRIRAWVIRSAGLFAKRQRERELADEMESHLEMQIADNRRSGMTQAEARRDALLKSGGIESAKEAYRDRGTIPFVQNVLQDTRFAIRQLRKNPAFTCVAILMLALGVAASAALFSFVDATLLKPLPYADPNRLVSVTERSALFPHGDISYLDYVDWKRLNKAFRSLDVYTGTGYLLSTASGAAPVAAARVSDGFFRTLGITPALGRDFYIGEDAAGAAKTVILSYGSWQKRFGGAKNVIGRTIRLSEVPHTIVGVLPSSFQFAPQGSAELWTALDGSGSCQLGRSCHNLEGVARLKEGVSVESALANMTGIAKQLERQYPASNRGQGASVEPLSEAIVGTIRPILLVLLGGGLLLLLIACVNVASLLLARSESRRREIAVRSSLGASSMRLVRQFMTEAWVLIAAASIAGLILLMRCCVCSRV